MRIRGGIIPKRAAAGQQGQGKGPRPTGAKARATPKFACRDLLHRHTLGAGPWMAPVDTTARVSYLLYIIPRLPARL